MSKKTVQLATPLIPSPEVFQRVGFTFKTGKNNKEMATLPEGWTTNRIRGNIASEVTLYDEKRRARGHSDIVSNAFKNQVQSYTRMYTRYSIQVINMRDNHPDGNYEVFLCKIEPSFANQDSRLNHDIVFTAGRTQIEPKYDYIRGVYSDSNRAVRKCIEFANKNFPDWQNPEAYWDD